MAAQPFRDAVTEGEEEDARRSRPPQRPGEGGGGGGKQRQSAGQQHRHEGQLPGMSGGVDEKGFPDPVQADEELAEAEPPAREGGGAHRALIGPGRIDQQDQRGKADEQERKPAQGGKA